MDQSEGVDGPGGHGDFESWVRENWIQLLGIGRVVTADPTLADDVLQDCLVDLHRQWDRLQGEGSHPLAYAARVMGSKAANHRRTSWARRVRVTDDVTTLDQSASLASSNGDASPHVVDRLAVTEALKSLSSRQRQVVAMHYLLDMPVTDIARALGKPVGSVTSDLTRARKRLRRQLAEGGDHGQR